MLKSLAAQQDAIQSESQGVEEQAKTQRHEATSTFKELTNRAQQLKDETAKLNDDLDKTISELAGLESGIVKINFSIIKSYNVYLKLNFYHMVGCEAVLATTHILIHAPRTHPAIKTGNKEREALEASKQALDTKVRASRIFYD